MQPDSGGTSIKMLPDHRISTCVLVLINPETERSVQT